jgi:hypothetical protein
MLRVKGVGKKSAGGKIIKSVEGPSTASSFIFFFFSM